MSFRLSVFVEHTVQRHTRQQMSEQTSVALGHNEGDTKKGIKKENGLQNCTKNQAISEISDHFETNRN